MTSLETYARTLFLPESVMIDEEHFYVILFWNDSFSCKGLIKKVFCETVCVESRAPRSIDKMTFRREGGANQLLLVGLVIVQPNRNSKQVALSLGVVVFLQYQLNGTQKSKKKKKIQTFIPARKVWVFRLLTYCHEIYCTFKSLFKCWCKYNF